MSIYSRAGLWAGGGRGMNMQAVEAEPTRNSDEDYSTLRSREYREDIEARVRQMERDGGVPQEQDAPAAAKTPSPAGRPAAGMRMMSVPEGATVKRTVTMADPAGGQVREVASWTHSPVAPAPMEQPGRFERLDMQRDNMGGTVQARSRRMENRTNLRMMETGRLDRIGKENADRDTAATIEAIKAGGEVVGKQATAIGMRDQGATAATASAQMDAANRGREDFFKGLDYAGKQRDDQRADAQLGLQTDQATRAKEWDDEVRSRATTAAQDGRTSNAPIEEWKDPKSGHVYYRDKAEIDPKTGAPTGWKPVKTDLMGSLGAASGVAGTEPGAPATPATTPAAAPKAAKKVIFQGRSPGGRNYRRFDDGSVETF
jgi:hypothetical protein